MKIIKPVCPTCRGTGRSMTYKEAELREDGLRTLHFEEDDCYECGGKGYSEAYARFTVEEAKAILEYCGLPVEVTEDECVKF